MDSLNAIQALYWTIHLEYFSFVSPPVCVSAPRSSVCSKCHNHCGSCLCSSSEVCAIFSLHSTISCETRNKVILPISPRTVPLSLLLTCREYACAYACYRFKHFPDLESIYIHLAHLSYDVINGILHYSIYIYILSSIHMQLYFFFKPP